MFAMMEWAFVASLGVVLAIQIEFLIGERLDV